MACRGDTGVRTFAITDGGSNACALGSDGCIYVTQLGGVWRGWRAEKMATPGIQRIDRSGRVERVVDLHVGPPMPTTGTTLDGLFDVSFADCRVPADALLGEEGRGFDYAMESLNDGRINVAAIAIAMGRYAVALAIEHVKTRIAFGQPIVSNQVVQHMLADASMELHAGWLMVLDAARGIDAGRDAASTAAMAKVYCTEAATRAIDVAEQLFGAAGYTRGMAAERLYRDVRVLRIYEGASEILCNQIARKLLASS